MSLAPPSGFTIRNQLFDGVPQEAALYLVSTPVGNLGDITLRALEVLSGCDVIACEDTRTSGVLLKRYGIDRKKISYTEHNAAARGEEILRRIGDGEAIALISDAGTPLVSDPGFRLVEEAVAQGISVIPIPGASAPLAALVGSGLPNDDFRFVGFLPTKAQAKEQKLQSLVSETPSLMFFESPARISATLSTAADVFGNERRACVARELTKMHETFHRGSLAELAIEFATMERVRGEIVLVIEGASPLVATAEDAETLLREALKTMKTKDAAAEVSRITGLSRQDLYKQALALKKKVGG